MEINVQRLVNHYKENGQDMERFFVALKGDVRVLDLEDGRQWRFKYGERGHVLALAKKGNLAETRGGDVEEIREALSWFEIYHVELPALEEAGA